MENKIKTNKWSIFVGVAVVALTVKTFLPDVWTSFGQAIQPVIDGAHRVVAPAFEKDQYENEGEILEMSNPDQDNKTNQDDEEYLFWEPVKGKPE